MARLRLSSTLPFRDRGDFAPRNDFAVLIANFVCGDLVYPGVSKDLRSARRVAVPFIGSEISLCDFLSIIKKAVFFGEE